MPESSPTLPAAVLFDLDGTLVDSVPDLAAATNHALTALDLTTCHVAEVRGWVGDGVEALLSRAITSRTGQGTSDEQMLHARSQFEDYYQKNLCADSELYPGIRPLLNDLQDKGCKLGCVTNKPIAFTKPLLRGLDITAFFSFVIGGDEPYKRKPAPDQVLLATARLSVPAHRTVLVGDSMNDVEAATAAGVYAIAVDWGYTDKVVFDQADVAHVVSNAKQLQALLIKLLCL